MNFSACLVGETLNLLSGGSSWVDSGRWSAEKHRANASELFGLFVFFSPFHKSVHARMLWQTSLECSLLMSPPGCLLTRRTHEFAPSAFTVVTHVGGEREHQRDKHLPAAESVVSAWLTAIHLHSSQHLGPVLPVMKSCNSWGGNWWPICLTLSSRQMLLPPSYWLIILLLFPAVSSTKLFKHL